MCQDGMCKIWPFYVTLYLHTKIKNSVTTMKNVRNFSWLAFYGFCIFRILDNNAFLSNKGNLKPFQPNKG